MVPITRLRTTKRTVGVNQLLTEVHMERVEETDSANMAEARHRDGRGNGSESDLFGKRRRIEYGDFGINY